LKVNTYINITIGYITVIHKILEYITLKCELTKVDSKSTILLHMSFYSSQLNRSR